MEKLDPSCGDVVLCYTHGDLTFTEDQAVAAIEAGTLVADQLGDPKDEKAFRGGCVKILSAILGKLQEPVADAASN